jgi:hypothetical protein
MIVAQKYNWRLLFASDDHKYFADDLTGRIAVAVIHPTDDGVLWLDSTRPIVASDEDRFVVSVPVVNLDGKQFCMPASQLVPVVP